jgi:hypothetical protein
MVESSVVDDAVAEQRPLLHQSEHGIPPVSALRAIAPTLFEGDIIENGGVETG